MSSRSISLDQSALSPKEYQSYKFFIYQFQCFTSSRSGRLRFAEAAQFLRSYFPFETEREDEIRRFFPQKAQLGEIDQGCVLAILRLLSHINNRKSTSHPFQLYRDLIFLQTDPLPSLPQSQQPSINSSTSSDPPSYSDKIIPSSSLSSNPFHSPESTRPNIHQSSQSAPLPPPKPSSSPPTSKFHRSNTIPIPTPSSPTSNSPQPLSDHELHTSSLPSGCYSSQSAPVSKNPFRVSSISRKSDSNRHSRSSSPPNTNTLTCPCIPPRPAISLVTTNTLPSEIKSAEDSCSQTPSSTKALPPPKHYSQRVSKHFDGIHSHHEPIKQSDPLPTSNHHSVSPDNRALTQPTSIPTPRKIIPKPKILPWLQVNQPQINSVGHTYNSAPQVQSSEHAPPSNSNHISSNSPFVSSSEYTNPPTRPPTKPMRPEKTEIVLQQQKMNGVVLPQEAATASSMTLTRSQTFNHQRRVAPPLPPPRKRRESLNVHNPDSVPLDQLVQLTCNDSNDVGFLNTPGHLDQTSEKSWINNNIKRSVSNSTSSVLPKTSSNYHRSEEEKIVQDDTTKKERKFMTTEHCPPRRSVSLLVQNKPTLPATGTTTTTTTTESVIDHLKAIETGLRHDGKELVKEVKEGWRSRHGQKEERAPLVSRKADLSTTTISNSRNNDFHHKHLGNLVSSRWKVSKHSNDNLHLVNGNLDLDDDQSSDSLNHHQHFSNVNSWHQLP